MNRPSNREQRFQDFVDRTLAPFKATPESAASACDRVMNRLRTEEEPALNNVANDFESVAPAQGWFRPVFAVSSFVVATAIVVFLQMPAAPLIHDARGVVEVADGGLSRVDAGVALYAGDAVEPGEVVGTNGKTGAVLRLMDGSTVEMRAKTELSLEMVVDGVQIRLQTGSVIVNAAKQTAGRHLYVQTNDVKVSVVGTVFLVNAEEEGSRVAVISGEVRVSQRGHEEKLLPGEQLTSNPAMEKPPVIDELLWSRRAETHVAMLQQNRPVEPASAQPITRPADTPKWEAVSVRQCRGDSSPGAARGGGNGGAPSPGAMGTSPGRLRVTCMPLEWLIERAYVKYLESDMKPTWFFPISGGPSWLGSDLYSIQAKAEGLPSDREMRGPMLQALLEERFELRIRPEVRQEPVFELRVSDAGTKLKPLPEGECAARDSGAEDPNLPGEQRLKLALEALSRPLPPCGAQMIGGPRDGTKAPPGTRTVNVYGGSLDLLIRNLSLDRIVLDKTGLKGLYDMSLTYSRELSPMREPPPPSNEPGGGDSIFDAFEKQLGLKLVPIRGPRTYYTIEHVARPSEN